MRKRSKKQTIYIHYFYIDNIFVKAVRGQLMKLRAYLFFLISIIFISQVAHSVPDDGNRGGGSSSGGSSGSGGSSTGGSSAGGVGTTVSERPAVGFGDLGAGTNTGVTTLRGDVNLDFGSRVTISSMDPGVYFGLISNPNVNFRVGVPLGTFTISNNVVSQPGDYGFSITGTTRLQREMPQVLPPPMPAVPDYYSLRQISQILASFADKSIATFEMAASSFNIGSNPIATALRRGVNVAKGSVLSAGIAVNAVVLKIFEPHITAVSLGIQRADSKTEELAAKGLSRTEIELETARAFYSGVLSAYNALRTPDDRRVVPTGPIKDIIMSGISSGRIARGDVTLESVKLAEILDAKFLQGKIDISLPGTQLFADGRFRSSELYYNDLTPSQRLGVQNAVMILGSATELAQISGLLGNTTIKNHFTSGGHGAALGYLNDMIAGGVIMINTNKSQLGRDITIKHELLHVGDLIVGMDLERRLTSTTTMNPELVEYRHEVIIPMFGCSENGCDVKNANISQYPGLAGLINDRYLSTVMEVRAHLQELNQGGAGYADNYYSRLAEAEGLTLQEAEEVVDILRNDPVLNELDRVLQDHAEDILAGR